MDDSFPITKEHDGSSRLKDCRADSLLSLESMQDWMILMVSWVGEKMTAARIIGTIAATRCDKV
ncbi:hypothetical protein KIN20_020810 [Parelaphostrongylus tenuis]|uniref:Uncharacterized protein n=1 Tax=Parelaphostrongylus tenuis TaxID=148309 RepID=A0AAD5N3L6_PARTN|nr:hypothetical protein KIN20_020810 [Parelaphostrongylus tenuis]